MTLIRIRQADFQDQKLTKKMKKKTRTHSELRSNDWNIISKRKFEIPAAIP